MKIILSFLISCFFAVSTLSADCGNKNCQMKKEHCSIKKEYKKAHCDAKNMNKQMQGSCGTGKCGANMQKKGSCGAGKCGGEMKKHCDMSKKEMKKASCECKTGGKCECKAEGKACQCKAETKPKCDCKNSGECKCKASGKPSCDCGAKK